jgi:ribosomal protein S18 acetylase RimI-like enzyme
MPWIMASRPIGRNDRHLAQRTVAGHGLGYSQEVGAARPPPPPTHVQVRIATAGDSEQAARLLHDFNREFGEPAPPVSALSRRVASLIDGGDTVVILGGDGPDGVAVLRLRPALWSEHTECYLAELYVRPALRGRGLGRAIMQAVLAEARRRDADTIEIGVDEPDLGARHLYESLGFTNRVREGDEAVMYVYELDLRKE